MAVLSTKVTLCNLKELMRRATSTQGLKVHIHEAKFSLFRNSYSCVKTGLLESAPSFARQIGFKTNWVLDQIIHLLNTLANEKY